jgi:hypothetical protein
VSDINAGPYAALSLEREVQPVRAGTDDLLVVNGDVLAGVRSEQLGQHPKEREAIPFELVRRGFDKLDFDGRYDGCVAHDQSPHPGRQSPTPVDYTGELGMLLRGRL